MFIVKVIKKIQLLIYRSRVLNINLLRFSNYLQNGKYLVNKQKNLIILESDKKMIGSIKGYFDLSFNKKRIIKNHNENHSFSAMLICDNGKKVKLFSHKDKLVRTYFDSQSEMNYFIENKKNKVFFPTSELYLINEKELLVDEQFLISENYSLLSKIIRLISFYKDFYGHGKKNDSHHLSELNNHCIRVSFIDRFKNFYKINSFCVDNIPWFFQHGDLWDANVFFETDSIKFIDFDKCGYYPIFYDLSVFIFTEGFFKRNDNAYSYIFNGEIDKLIGSELLFGYQFINYFIFCIEIMCLVRHEMNSQYEIVDEVLDHLNKVGFEI